MTSGDQDTSPLGNQVNINIQPSITAIWKKLGSEGLPVRPCSSIYLCSWRSQTSLSVSDASVRCMGLNLSLELKHTTFLCKCGCKYYQQTGHLRERCPYSKSKQSVSVRWGGPMCLLATLSLEKVWIPSECCICSALFRSYGVQEPCPTNSTLVNDFK